MEDSLHCGQREYNLAFCEPSSLQSGTSRETNASNYEVHPTFSLAHIFIIKHIKHFHGPKTTEQVHKNAVITVWPIETETSV